MSRTTYGAGVEITGRITPEYAQILTPEAVAFAVKLQRAFGSPARRAAGACAPSRQTRVRCRTSCRTFCRETRSIREADWTLRAGARRYRRPPRRDHRARRPQDGHQRAQLRRQRVHGRLRGRQYAALGQQPAGPHQPARRRSVDASTTFRPRASPTSSSDKLAMLFVRPRGWHLPEKHVKVDGAPISGGIFDFALYFFHNAKELVARGSGPYFYLPKLESHLEARLWNDVFVMAQDDLGVPRGTIKATVLIETILAAYEMDEILYELREHSAGLNAGRWDYIFSCIKKFRSNKDFCLADRALVTMTTHFMKSYAELLDQDLPPPQHPRDGRHGGADSGQERREGQRRGIRQGQDRQGARGDLRARRHLGRAPGAGARGARGVQPVDADAEPDRAEAARRRAGHRRRPRHASSPSSRSPKTGCA